MKKLTAFFAFLVLFCACRRHETTAFRYGNARLYLTARNTTDRLTFKGSLPWEDDPQPEENKAAIMIFPEITFQTLIGFGGALTDAAAETMAKLPYGKQQEILIAYYHADSGIGYTLGRIPIHSCDFSSHSYTYVAANDTSLSTFTIDPDRAFRLPLIKRIVTMVPNITLFASPWSPPAWMKTNHNMLYGGKLKPECRQAWANYYVKFIQAYRKEGIRIWGITVQNEPMAMQTWESCIYTAEEERDFIKNYLGPTLHRNGLKDIRLIIWDHNRGIMFQRAHEVYSDPEASRYVWGTGFHWYAGDHFDNVNKVRRAYPQKHLLLTEACNYPFDPAKISDWNWGENYGRSIIHDINNGAEGWTDWNIVLDEKGGPNHVGNYCFAPIHGNTQTGEVIYQNSYYYIGHFSKFMRPGAQVIASSSNHDALRAVAAINPDGSVAVVVMNESDNNIECRIWVNKKSVRTHALAHSIFTMIF